MILHIGNFKDKELCKFGGVFVEKVNESAKICCLETIDLERVDMSEVREHASDALVYLLKGTIISSELQYEAKRIRKGEYYVDFTSIKNRQATTEKITELFEMRLKN